MILHDEEDIAKGSTDTLLGNALDETVPKPEKLGASTLVLYAKEQCEFENLSWGCDILSHRW